MSDEVKERDFKLKDRSESELVELTLIEWMICDKEFDCLYLLLEKINLLRASSAASSHFIPNIW